MKKLLLIALSASALIAGMSVQAQTCNDQIRNVVPTSRYQLNADGTARDLRTGLVWMRCAMGQKWVAGKQQCTGKAASHTWKAALQAAQSLDQGDGFAGYNDWRLPNLREITSIESFHCSDPAINLEVFPNTPSAIFWSSSPLEVFPGRVWALDFDTKHVVRQAMTSELPIRLVRGGAYPNKIPPPATSPAPGTSSTSAHIVE